MNHHCQGFVLVVLVVLPIVTIHKRVLKPRRLEAIGASLNYVGGWLGTLIYALLGSAVASLVFYLLSAKKQIEYFCRDEQTWHSLFQCLKAFVPETLGTPLTIIFVIASVVGAICAALALMSKKGVAVSITGYLSLVLLLLNAVFLWQGTAQTGDGYSRSPMGQAQTRAIFFNVLLLVYLVASRRMRAVYGRNFGESSRLPVGGQSQELT